MSYTFTRTPITELPVVIELDGEPAWIAWDYAVRTLEANTPDGRAKALADLGVFV